MVAKNSADSPIFRGLARQRGRGFGALAQFLGRIAIPYIKNMYSPSCEKNWSRFVWWMQKTQNV